ncbi:helix-turn-helix domain-containing protein [Rhizobium tubonense]
MPCDKNPFADVGFAGLPSRPLSPETAAEQSGAVGLQPSSLPLRTVCRIVGQMTSEIFGVVGSRVQLRRDRRRTLCHVRQIAMYICHVALRIPLHEIGLAFGRDRTTVGHACHVVEDRRDDPAFDDFVGAVERIVTSAFSASGIPGHE